ncbi:MAG: hypothetical protein M3471_04560 [Actinomycetota bacterium]|nr:hypothetical protein [Actinomycetota bacterium]
MASATGRMKVTVVLAERARLALHERTQVVMEAAPGAEVVVAASPREALSRLVSTPLSYLLDVNTLTARVALGLVQRRQPYVVDTGDDPATLARGGHGRLVAGGRQLVERLMLQRARGVVCRGSFHLAVLRAKTNVPLWWAPDTVPDDLLDGNAVSDVGDPGLVASFGSASEPGNGDRVYGWEVVDLVASSPTLEGLLVVNGPGIEALRRRAKRLGVSSRVVIEGPRPLLELAHRLRPAGFVTSVQSDDLAGWVRTTGKLPIALGLGKALVATRVGEASRVLPDRFLVDSAVDDELVAQMAVVIESGIPDDWPSQARSLAEPFRRSTVAAGLGRFLASL